MGTLDTASLLPYLKTDGTGFHIKLSVSEQNDSDHRISSFPFLVTSQSGPFSRIIHAVLETDTETHIEPLFLLIQRDEYPLSREELWSLDNTTIDQYWQRTLAFHSSEKFGSRPLTLINQMDNKGVLLPFQPLLYCKFKQTYFHLPCPHCGAVLQQCNNDDMLQKYGLQTYSGSLKRYLFCAACILSKETPHFYVSALADNDPEFLKDRFDLIKNLGRLKGNKNPECELPCMDCNQYPACYGPDGLAVSRIAPLSFYPFYMLMFKSGSMNAMDFLSLISGASCQELENRLLEKQQPGRRHCLKVLKDKGSLETPFFFQNKDRSFLEVLYLKLVFLDAIAKMTFSGLDTFQYPGLGLSIDRIWVKLSDQDRLLPAFWNFKIEFLDVMGTEVQPFWVPKLSQTYGLHFLGSIWFTTLLVNSKQDVSRVYQAIKEAVEDVAGKDDTTFEDYLEKDIPPVLFPENIFYDPEAVSVDKKWHKFWEASLFLGFHLLESSLKGLKFWSPEKFMQNLKTLERQIRDSLFQPESSVSAEKPTVNERAIYDILKKIMDAWQEKVEIPSDESETIVISSETDAVSENESVQTTEEEDDDVLRTVILSPDGLPSEKPVDLEQEEELAETVIISRNDIDKSPPLTPKTPDTIKDTDNNDEDLEATVILSPDDLGRDRSPSLPDESDDLPETVIISPQQSPLGSSTEDAVPGGPVKTGPPPDKTPAQVKQKNKFSDDDEPLDETIIIQTGKIKDDP